MLSAGVSSLAVILMAAGPYDEKSDQELLSVHEKLMSAWFAGDVRTVASLCEQDAVFVPESGGDAASLPAAMRLVARERGAKGSVQFVHRELSGSDYARIVTGVLRVDRERGGRWISTPLRSSTVWIRKASGWKLSQLHQSLYTNFESSIAGFEKADAADAPQPGGVVFVGSSSIRGWKTLARDFPGVNTVHRGFGGSQLVDSIAYVHRIITPYRPSKVVVYAGDNDVAAGKSAQRVASDFRALVEAIHSRVPEAEIGFIAIKPSLARWELWNEMNQANALIGEYAASQPRVTYLDIATPMLGDDGRPRPELFVKDGLHMTPAGYEVWTRVVRPWVSGE